MQKLTPIFFFRVEKQNWSFLWLKLVGHCVRLEAKLNFFDNVRNRDRREGVGAIIYSLGGCHALKQSHQAFCVHTGFCSQFHQHFTNNFCANILSTKKYKAKPFVKKSFSKHLWTKKSRVKCCLNWHITYT